MGQRAELHREIMKVILLVAGSDGDIHPPLGLGCELVRRGHDVLFVTTFDYVELAQACGLQALSVIGPAEAEEFKRTDNLGPVAKIKARCKFFSQKVDYICEVLANKLADRSIVVAPPFGYAVAKLLHLGYGVPYISTVLAPANLCSLKNPPAFRSGKWLLQLPYAARWLLFRSAERMVVDPVIGMLLKRTVRRLALPSPRRVVSEWCYSPQGIMGLFGEWFCPRPDDWPGRMMLTGFPLFDPHRGDQELSVGLKRFLDAGPPPVVFTRRYRDTRAPRLLPGDAQGGGIARRSWCFLDATRPRAPAIAGGDMA